MLFEHVGDADRGGDRLRDHRGAGDTRHAELKNEHAQKVERHVEQRAENEEDQRRFAVAERAQHGGRRVVGELCDAEPADQLGA